MTWFPVRTLAIACGILGLALALILVFAGGGRSTSRRLALPLAVEAVTFSMGEGWMYVTDSYSFSYAAQALTIVGASALPWLYLRFFATLDSPLSNWLLRPVPSAALVALAIICPLVVAMKMPLFLPGLVPIDDLGYWDSAVTRPVALALFLLWMSALMFGLACAIWALRRARSALRRQQMRFYLVAFAVRDVPWALVVFLVWTGIVPLPNGGTTLIFSVADLGFLFLVTYGMLKAHLFDVDLRIKWTLRRGTVAGIFLAVFFVVAQLAQNFFSSTYGWAVGGVAAGLLLFALTPIQRAAERMSNAALPGVTGSPEYLAFRKLEIYRATAEGVVRDGKTTARERTMLDALRKKLGITAADARRVEADAASG